LRLAPAVPSLPAPKGWVPKAKHQKQTAFRERGRAALRPLGPRHEAGGASRADRRIGDGEAIPQPADAGLNRSDGRPAKAKAKNAELMKGLRVNIQHPDTPSSEIQHFTPTQRESVISRRSEHPSPAMQGPPTFDQLWTALDRQEKARQQGEADRICALLQQPGGIPAGPEVVKALTWLPQKQAEAILRAHPGRSFAQLKSSYFQSLSVLDLSLNDLFAAIATFEHEALAEENTIFQRTRQEALNAIEQRIQKELFAVTSASHSLVDHTRRLLKAMPVDGHEMQRQASFGADGLHEFVIGLRTLLHHIQIVNAGYQTSHSAAGKAATFILHKQEVEQALEDSREGFSASQQRAIDFYLAKAASNIDLRSLFELYQTRLKDFHAWLRQRLMAEVPPELQDYNRLILERKKESTRLWWNALLGNWLRNWKVPPNPHHHLHKYLTAEQMSAVYSLPRNSNEQVDLVISYLDTDGAITEALRAQAYELFERAPE